ncbi:phenylalanine--tRNA ligase subunit alpha [Spirochaetota bacterium]
MEKTGKFPKDQFMVLNYLNSVDKKTPFEELIEKTGLDQVFISSAVMTLNENGLVETSEKVFHEISPGKGAEPFLGSQLPEKTIIKCLNEKNNDMHLNDISKETGLEQKIIGKNIKVLLDKGWAEKKGPNLEITDKGKKAASTEQDDDKVFKLLNPNKPLLEEESVKEYDFFKKGIELLKNRSQFIQVKKRSKKSVWLNKKGKDVLKKGISELIEVTILSSDLLKDGKWRDVEFKPYNVKDEAANQYPGKIHPFQKILNSTRKIYLELGFQEIESPYVESAFWDFDALFQPQDHPARDMQDTFYMKKPGMAELPDKSLVQNVWETHENGGESGSLGWGYKWNVDLAKKLVLRTHTTSASIRQLYKTPKAPLKVFCIGRIFRRETVDYKHLPAFTQVDGIIVDKNASLAHLIGILKEFYRKMGFDKIEVRPAFFPYTEPSLEIFLYLKEKDDWMEMGGAGIFRREVTVPMGCDEPVLAWGLGLERLAMFKYGLTDIRDIYMANIKWLREVESCQL